MSSNPTASTIPEIYMNRKQNEKQTYHTVQGRIQDKKLGGALKIIAPSGAKRENIWGISYGKSRFYAKKSYIFQFLGGGGAPGAPAPAMGTVPKLQ